MNNGNDTEQQNHFFLSFKKFLERPKFSKKTDVPQGIINKRNGKIKIHKL